MPVEVNDVVRLTAKLGVPQLPREHVERGRAQDVELHDLARRVVEPLDELSDDGAEGNILAGAGATDDEQDADGSAARVGRAARELGWHTVPANERLRFEGERGLALGIADQLPRDRCRVPDVGDDLDAGVGKLFAGEIPDTLGVPVSEENGTAEIVADRGHPGLDVGRDLRRGIKRKEKVVLQVPADALAVVRGEVERERHRRGEPPGAAFERDLDLVVARRGLGGFGDPKRSTLPVTRLHGSER